MIQKALPYTLFGVIVLLSSATFLYNRALAVYSSYRVLSSTSDPKLATQYTHADRYSLLQKLVTSHPEHTLYFITNSSNPVEKSSSWQMIQTRYQAYPRMVTTLSFGKDDRKISELALATVPVIVVSPFKQPSMEIAGTSMHPHSEYYVYIIPKE